MEGPAARARGPAGPSILPYASGHVALAAGQEQRVRLLARRRVSSLTHTPCSLLQRLAADSQVALRASLQPSVSTPGTKAVSSCLCIAWLTPWMLSPAP